MAPVRWIAVALACVACSNTVVQRSHPTIRADPQALSFGDLAPGAHATLTVTVHNDGAVPLLVSEAGITGDARNAFSHGSLANELAAGASAPLTVTYTAPATDGADGATLTILSNADNAPELSISLTGRTVTPPVPLSVTLSGTGGGSVTSAPAGIACGATCSASYAPGTSVTLTATPAAGSVFTGFSGDCTGATCTVAMSAAKNVTATFTKQHTLAVTVTGGGSVSGSGINCPGTCSVALTEGTAVSLTATADSGSRFGGWGGACTNATGACAFTLTADATVTATFVAQHTVTVTFAGAGAGTVDFGGAATPCTATCTRTFDAGTALTLTGTASSGVFSGFSGDCSGTPSCAIASLGADASVTATFTPTYTLTVGALGSGGGTIAGGGIACTAAAGATSGTCDVILPAGSSVTLSAAADGASTFTGWSNACTNATGDCVVTLSGDKTATASFGARVNVSVTVSGTGTVTSSPAGIDCPGTCSAKFDPGTAVTLQASEGACSGVTYSGACTQSGTGCALGTVTSDASVTASFTSAAAPGTTVGGVVSGLSGTGFVLSNGFTGGAAEQLSVTSNGTFTFCRGTGSTATYAVAIDKSPTNPDGSTQSCAVTASGTGTASAAGPNVTNVQVDCTPFVVAAPLYGPSTTHVFGTRVYFATNSNASCYQATGTTGDNVWWVSASGGTPSSIAAVDHSSGNCGVYGLASDGTYLYWLNYADGWVKNSNLDGSNVVSVVQVASQYANALAVGGDGHAYYHVYPSTAIGRVGTDGTGATTFANTPSNNGLNLAIDASYLYWSDSIAGTVNRASLTSSLPASATSIATGEGNPYGLFVSASTAYWLYGTTVRYVSLSGGSAAQLVNLTAPNSVIADAAHAWVSDGGASGTIYKLPAGGGTAIAVGKALNNPHDLAMDAGHIYWANGASNSGTGSITMIVK